MHSPSDWDKLYEDLPSRMTKVRVRDRTAVQTANAERTCTAPAGLQEAVDRLVGREDPRRRAFVRPSGTEDVVRVYAEGNRLENPRPCPPNSLNVTSLPATRFRSDPRGC
jgi:phosphoacetylglucosamine mutase